MRNRDAWLAALAATLGISEEACRREAAPQVQQVASAASSSAPVVVETAPSASADIAPSATASAIASAAPSASASAVVKPKIDTNPFANVDPIQGICGASMEPIGSCGVSTYRPGMIGTAAGIGSIGLGHSNACGAPGNRPSTNTSARAEIALSVNGGTAGDDHVATNLRPRFRACANQALAADPSMQGKVVLVVKIGANGLVDTSDVASNNGVSTAAAQCMARIAKNTIFPSGAARTLTIAINQTKQSP